MSDARGPWPWPPIDDVLKNALVATKREGILEGLRMARDAQCHRCTDPTTYGPMREDGLHPTNLRPLPCEAASINRLIEEHEGE